MTDAAIGPARARKLGVGRRLLGTQNRNLWFWVFVGPFMAGLALFVVVPIVWSIYLSFHEARGVITPTRSVGFDNYTAMLRDPAFRDSLWTFVVFAAIIVPVTFGLALLLAVMVARTRVMQTFFRSVFFLPTACSYVVASLIWRTAIFSGSPSGVANTVMRHFGESARAWIDRPSPPWYWLVISSARLWLQLGFYMILFLAGLQRISPTLYEAGEIDGANAWQQFRHITMPQLRPTSVAVLLLLLINAFQAFDEFLNILGKQDYYPPYARPPLIYLYYIALKGSNFGMGSAGAVILTIIIAVVAIVFSRVSRTSETKR